MLTDDKVIAYSESEAYPTIGVILLGGISDKMRRVPMHTSAGFAYEGLEEQIKVVTKVAVNTGSPYGTLNGDPIGYSDTGRSPFVMLNRYKEKILENNNLKDRELSISFSSENYGVLSGSSDAGAAALGSSVNDLSGGVSDFKEFEDELRTISESVGRSLHGGLTITWADGKTARTERLLDPSAFRDYAVIGCRFDVKRKPSDRIHENQVNDPDYHKRVASTLEKGKQIVRLAEDKDIKGIFDLGHYDTAEYHSLNEKVGVKIITPEMRNLMDLVDEMRKASWLSYIVTGGSNVFVATEKKNLKEYTDVLREKCDGITILKVAEKAHVISRLNP